MCGVLPIEAAMTGRLTLGYRQARAETDSVLAAAGDVVRAHEFHRTAASPDHGDPPPGPRARPPARSDRPRREGHVTGTVHASYLHAHWAGYPQRRRPLRRRLPRTAAARAARAVAASTA